jgi:diguanylate cyclase (GGDEF)-like protein
MSVHYPEVSEKEYVEHYHVQDHAQGRKILRFLMWVSFPLLYLDFALQGIHQVTGLMEPRVLGLIVLRLAVCGYAWWILRVTGRRSDRLAFELHLYRWSIVVLATQLISNFLSPASYLGHFIIDAWLCLIIAIVLPLRPALLRQLVFAYFFASLALVLSKQFPSVFYQFTVVVMLILSTYSGQSIHRFLRHYRLKLLSAESELQRKETTDPLTGIANRREFMRVTENELQRHLRLGKPLSLVVLDLDHLQELNLHYGADVGDMVLVEVSKRMKRATRGYDCLARYGTEEFCVLLPEAGDEVAEKIAARTRSTVQAMPVAAAGRELKISASVGVATLRQGDTVETMLRRAEEALMHAKEGELGEHNEDAADALDATHPPQAFA